MGFTGLARWQNAPPEGLTLIHKNIVLNHRGVLREKWYLTIKSFRTNFSSIPGIRVPSERLMWSVTMKDNAFVILEDGTAPTRFDVLQNFGEDVMYETPHFRQTHMTCNPPGALEALLDQLQARWVSTRGHSQPSGAPQSLQDSGPQLTIIGQVFAVGTDWIVRAGTVQLSGGAMKGMLLEAEYLPLSAFPQTTDETSELLSNFITAMLPHTADAKTVAITISDSQWEELFWDHEDRKGDEQTIKPPEDIYVSGEDMQSEGRKEDWIGVERDRRAAYLVMGGLRMEGLL
ncbi:unnamed protein product [Somion occarium]|uniref:Mediator of RNA polymerase II transcription subunit 20 n=1 Tax=Somion occarium TaxID=3059160 RepID=A0ABP1CYB9_9APHY